VHIHAVAHYGLSSYGEAGPSCHVIWRGAAVPHEVRGGRAVAEFLAGEVDGAAGNVRSRTRRHAAASIGSDIAWPAASS